MPLIDERCIIGGPGISEIKTEKISKITKAQFYKYSFESFLDIEPRSIFSEYWRDYFPNNSIFDFNFTNINYCNNQCSFCTYNTKEKIKRDLENFLDTITKNNNLKYISLTAPTQTPESLKIIKKYYKKIKNSNTFLWSFLRADDDILNVLNTFDDLENIEFSNGLEFFANGPIKRINKNSTVESSIKLAEIIIKKNGKIAFTVIKCSPTLEENDFIESVKNLKIFKSLSETDNIFFRGGPALRFLNRKNELLKLTSNYEPIDFVTILNENELLAALSNDDQSKKYNDILRPHIDNLIINSIKKLKNNLEKVI